MHASVTFRTSDGELHRLEHGAIIGRLWSAALQLDDSRISEAHAMVSLRGSALKLLSLRGLFAVDGKPQKEVTLRPGLTLFFARGVSVEVTEVTLPVQVMALEGDGLPRQVLSGVCSLVDGPTPQIVAKTAAQASAVFWSTGDGWRVRVGQGAPEPLTPDWTLPTRAGRVWATAMPLSAAGHSATVAIGRVAAPLKLELHYDMVHIHRDGQPTVSLNGNTARILSEVGSVGTAIAWDQVATAIWSDTDDEHLLRRRWDSLLARLRRKLREEDIRPELIKTDGAGNIALVLNPTDELVDHS